ncbi:hypothetical protein D3C85_1383200 [compost metagenome]
MSLPIIFAHFCIFAVASARALSSMVGVILKSFSSSNSSFHSRVFARASSRAFCFWSTTF